MVYRDCLSLCTSPLSHEYPTVLDFFVFYPRHTCNAFKDKRYWGAEVGVGAGPHDMQIAFCHYSGLFDQFLWQIIEEKQWKMWWQMIGAWTLLESFSGRGLDFFYQSWIF